MTDDKTVSCAGWSLSTLYTHFTSLLKAQDERVAIALAAQKESAIAQKEAVMVAHLAAKEANNKAETGVDKRFNGVNELRGLVEDQQRTFMPRSECELRINAQDDRLAKLELQLAQRQGQNQGLGLGWSILLGAGGLAGMLYGLLK